MTIEFLLDENIPYAFIDYLEGKGYPAKHLKKLGLQGIKNGEVYKLAEDYKMWIVTRDADFQNLRKFASFNIGGVILFKLSVTKTENLIRIMDDILHRFSNRLQEKHLIIAEDNEIKIY